MINWKVRIKNKMFWMAIIPAVLLLAQTVLELFGVHFDFTDIQQKLLNIVEAVFVVLTILGIVTDMTTNGVGDSERALTYTKPYKDKE
jgi:phi LC3 family holin